MFSSRQTAWAAVLVLAIALTSVSAGPLAGVVLKSGQRFSGTLVSQRTDRVWLQIDGRQYSWSASEVAVIEFVPGQANRRELSALSSVPSQIGGVPAAAVVLQDGQIITGTFGGVLDDGRVVAFSTAGRYRTDMSTATIARLYLDPAAARTLYASNAVVDSAPQIARPAANAAQPAGPFSVDARGDWTRTGVYVREGERVSFEASGQVRWGSGRQQVAGPAGASQQTSDRQHYPVPQLGAGALVGRVGNSQPFAIGGSGGFIVMPADGELYLSVNDNQRGDNSGAFSVRVTRDNSYLARPGGIRGAGFGRNPLDVAGYAAVLVDARQEWTPTDVTVRQGERIVFQTTGQISWGEGATQVTGPEGTPMDARTRRDYPVSSAGVGALVARIDNGVAFLVGAGSEAIVMPTGGRLYLGVNDSGRTDNSGSFSVRITRDNQNRGGSGGIYNQDQVEFTGAASVRVDARQEWTAANVTVRQGERIAFQATGQVAWGAGASQVAGPEGIPMDASIRRDYPVPSAGVGALVARIGNGAPFLVGASSEAIVMPASGQLYLGVNDSGRGDNTGFFLVRIARAGRR